MSLVSVDSGVGNSNDGGSGGDILPQSYVPCSRDTLRCFRCQFAYLYRSEENHLIKYGINGNMYCNM